MKNGHNGNGNGHHNGHANGHARDYLSGIAISQFDFSALKPFVHRLDAVCTDADGTLFDNEWVELNIRLREEYNKFIIGNPNVRAEFRGGGLECCLEYAGMSPANIRKTVGHLVGCEIPVAVEAAIERRRKSSPERGETLKLIPGMAEIMNFFRTHDVPRIIVTSSEVDRIERYAVATGMGGLFDRDHNWVVSGKAPDNKPKPDPDTYSKARSEFEARPHRTLAFEDSISGATAATADGLVTIGVLYGTHITSRMKENVAREMISVGVTELVDRPEDLASVVLKVLSDVVKERPADRPTRTNPRQRLRGVGGSSPEATG